MMSDTKIARKYQIAVWYFLGHLALVAVTSLGIFRVQQSDSAPVRALGVYGDYSGAIGEFGFFAPGVGTQLRVSFRVEGDQSHHDQDFYPNAAKEVRLRVGNLVAAFGSYYKDERVRRALTASLAAHQFELNPSAKKVQVRFEFYSLPSMREFTTAQAPHWRPMYDATYAR